MDGLQGEAQPKQRLRCILSALFGLKSVAKACRELGIGPTYFRLLRIQVLQACLDALAPRPTGRPPLVPRAVRQELQEQRARIVELEREVQILRTQLELAAVTASRPKSRGRTRA